MIKTSGLFAPLPQTLETVDEIQRAFRKMIHENRSPAAQIFQMIKSVNISLLLEAAENLPELEHWCAKAELEEFWANIWHYLSREPTWQECQENSELHYSPLQPQAGISNFKLVQGMRYFQKATLLLEEEHQVVSASVMTLLNKAAGLHNYAALNALVALAISNESFSELEHAAMLLKNVVSSQGTPVLILHSQVYLGMARYWLLQQQAEREASAYQMALQYLYAAEITENDFAQSIHNAYYGKGLAASNEYGKATLAELIQLLFEEFELNRDLIACTRARTDANKLAASITRSTRALSPTILNL